MPRGKRLITTHSSRKIPNHDARISALELRISELENRLRTIRSNNLMDWSLPDPPKPKRGRKPKLQSFILMDRDEMIEMLESYWPEIGPFCNKVNEKLIRTSLELITHSDHREKAKAARHLLQHFHTLLAFLRSNRYRNEPRNIANAVAGVPAVSWWRSLRHCGSKEHRSEKTRNERAIRDYLRRKHPHLYRRFERANGDV